MAEARDTVDDLVASPIAKSAGDASLATLVMLCPPKGHVSACAHPVARAGGPTPGGGVSSTAGDRDPLRLGGAAM
jgi:hypothetical protein